MSKASRTVSTSPRIPDRTSHLERMLYDHSELLGADKLGADKLGADKHTSSFTPGRWQATSSSAPSPNLLKLAGFTNGARYVDVACKALAQMPSYMDPHQLDFSQWRQALSYALSPPRQVAIVGDPDAQDTRVVFGVGQDRYRSFQVVVLGVPDPAGAGASAAGSRPD